MLMVDSIVNTSFSTIDPCLSLSSILRCLHIFLDFISMNFKELDIEIKVMYDISAEFRIIQLYKSTHNRLIGWGVGRI